METSQTAGIYEPPTSAELLAQLDALAMLRPSDIMPLSYEDISPAWVTTTPVNGRHVYTSTYSCIGYSNREFRLCAQRVHADLSGIMLETEADAVVVRGGSGVVMGSALLMLGDIPLVVARKRGECSHGEQIEIVGGQSRRVCRYIILDDFVSSGETVRGIKDDMGGARCVGVVQYRYAASRTAMLKRADSNDEPRWHYNYG